MQNLQASLRTRLEGARSIAVLAMGSALKGDDAAGLLAAEHLEKACKPRPGSPRLTVLVGGTTPENLTGEIKQLQPTHLIVIDAAEMGEKPGHVALIEPAALDTGASMSTHRLPLQVLMDYLHRFIACEIIVIGIQATGREFGHAPSGEVEEGAKLAAEAIAAAVNELRAGDA